MKYPFVFFPLLLTLSCFPPEYSKKHVLKKEGTKTYLYNSLTFNDFFEKLFKNHKLDYLKKENSSLISFFENDKLDTTNRTNIDTYLKIKLLHSLFTSKTASNCSKGEILNIPYYWHWVNPNPRYTIYSSKNGKLLKDTKPPTGFSKYKNSADVDRTPNIFLGDLFSDIPNYYAVGCDTFSTFGWCSEREMSFVLLMNILGFNSKVVAKGNHCWTEAVVSMRSNRDKEKIYQVLIDNTFDLVVWTEIKGKIDIDKWEKENGDAPLREWYNRNAHSPEYIELFNKKKLSTKALNRIEQYLVQYLNK